jgi:hypothetical protein
MAATSASLSPTREISSPVGLFIFPYGGPELCLGYLQLVPQDMTPQAGPVAAAIHRMRDPGAQDPSVRQDQLISDVMSTGAPARIADSLPSLGGTEGLVILAGGLRPAHRGDPASQSRN